jgi:hypothetical protein
MNPLSVHLANYLKLRRGLGFNLVRRDRNHPSIIAWGLGNEELSAQGKDEATKTLAVPNQDLVHRLDPTRPATFAMNWDWGNGFSKVLDVQGFNYWFQGTHGKSSGRFLDMDGFHAAFPNKPAFGSEEASTVSTCGIFENDKTRGYLSAYDRNLPRGGDAQREWGCANGKSARDNSNKKSRRDSTHRQRRWPEICRTHAACQRRQAARGFAVNKRIYEPFISIVVYDATTI